MQLSTHTHMKRSVIGRSRNANHSPAMPSLLLPVRSLSTHSKARTATPRQLGSGPTKWTNNVTYHSHPMPLCLADGEGFSLMNPRHVHPCGCLYDNKLRTSCEQTECIGNDCTPNKPHTYSSHPMTISPSHNASCSPMMPFLLHQLNYLIHHQRHTKQVHEVHATGVLRLCGWT